MATMQQPGALTIELVQGSKDFEALQWMESDQCPEWTEMFCSWIKKPFGALFGNRILDS